MTEDIEQQVLNKLRDSLMITLQVDESTDISEKVQLLVCVLKIRINLKQFCSSKKVSVPCIIIISPVFDNNFFR